MRNWDKRILSLLLAPLVLTLGGCDRSTPKEPPSETRLLLDTVCTISLYDPDADASVLTEALDLCAEYEALLSRTLEDSDIWRVNHAGGEPVTVDARTAEVIGAGLAFGTLADGAFDITIGRLSSLWDFGGSAAVPAPSDLALARATVDYRQAAVTGQTVRLSNPEAWLDLGGIAKGYIADRLADFLRERGVKGAVINLGGNVVTVGAKPQGGLWNVGVKQPFGEETRLLGVLATSEASVVTSGIYERQFEENGVLYHHVLDPATGYPVKSDVVSATVVSESSTAGDALTTILLLMGSERAESFLEQVPGVMGAVLVLENGELLQFGELDFQAGG